MNLWPLVAVKGSPATFVNRDVLTAPAAPLFAISITKEQGAGGGKKRKSPPFVMCLKIPVFGSGKWLPDANNSSDSKDMKQVVKGFNAFRR